MRGGFLFYIASFGTMTLRGLLSSGTHCSVVALSDTEAAKLFVSNSRSDIGSEAEKMKYANAVNDLVVRFAYLGFNDTYQAEILVMERIYPLDYRAHEVEKRELWLARFEQEVKQLHEAGFVHKHLKRLANLSGLAFDNILLTEKGLRLIDVGISALRSQVGDKLFDKYVETELHELIEFREYFLNR